MLGGAQGTASSKKKKQAKLKRVMHTVKKQARRERADGAEGFAAMQLLHDPQVLQACFRGSKAQGKAKAVVSLRFVQQAASGRACVSYLFEAGMLDVYHERSLPLGVLLYLGQVAVIFFLWL